MKNAAVIGAAVLAGTVSAFPAAVNEYTRRNPEAAHSHAKRLNGINPGFNATAQYVSTKGQYKFVAPGPTDLRGPCPGLNAMANHGYIPHNGIATIEEFIQGTYQAFGMGLDLGGFLAVYGAVFDGDLLSWSIGGPQTTLLNPVAGLLGTPEGISGSHNKYENDASPVRGDLFVYGNDYLSVVSQFVELYSYQASVPNAKSNYGLGILTDHRVNRFAASIDGNPYFFNGAFPGLLVQPAAYTFIYRFMANKSAEYPEGVLTQNVLKDFFSMTGTYPHFKYTPGYEKFPDNWYKRAIGDEYTIPFFLEDVVGAAEAHPQFLDVGGNLNGTNTFTPIDITNLTGGAYNTKTLLEGNNLGCFVYESLIQQAPDILSGLFLNPNSALNKLTAGMAEAFGSLGCTNLNDIQQNQFKQTSKTQFAKYPGYAKLKSDGTY